MVSCISLLLQLEANNVVYSLAGCAAAIVSSTLQISWAYSDVALFSVLLPMYLLEVTPTYQTKLFALFLMYPFIWTCLSLPLCVYPAHKFVYVPH